MFSRSPYLQGEKMGKCPSCGGEIETVYVVFEDVYEARLKNGEVQLDPIVECDEPIRVECPNCGTSLHVKTIDEVEDFLSSSYNAFPSH